jgi:Zn finger protein HypA/HybF involved in hydrogenase expression
MVEKPLRVCMMCGRNEFERPGTWTYGQLDDRTIRAVDLCEGCAPDFDPAASYDPIKNEMWATPCPECGNAHYVIEPGADAYICGVCGGEAPPLPAAS